MIQEHLYRKQLFFQRLKPGHFFWWKIPVYFAPCAFHGNDLWSKNNTRIFNLNSSGAAIVSWYFTTKKKKKKIQPQAFIYQNKNCQWGTSLVAKWLKIHLTMQGTQVQSLLQEDPTCRRATKPVYNKYWACALEPISHNYWAHSLQLEKACAQHGRPNAAKNK